MAEKGTVFLDAGKWPYLSRKWGDETWLFYWHNGEKHWVSLRPVKADEAFPSNLTQAEQDLYHEQHAKWESQFK